MSKEAKNTPEKIMEEEDVKTEQLADKIVSEIESCARTKENPKPRLWVLLANEARSRWALRTFDDTLEIWFYNEEKGHWTKGGETLLASNFQSAMEMAAKDTLLTAGLVEETLGHIRRGTYCKRADFEEKKKFVCLSNCVLNIETLEVMPHSAKFKFISKLAVKYKESADCPKIKKFLSEVLPPEQIPVVQELVGYLLLRDNRFQIAFMFVGEGSNGKSTLLSLLGFFLGAENYATMPVQQLQEDKFALVRLYGKHANIYSEIPNRALQNAAVFKALTGGDWLHAEEKFKAGFLFLNFAKLLFSANRLPYTEDNSDAFFRRWIILNFPNCFEGKEKRDLLAELTTEDELSGLLNWGLEGLARLRVNNKFSNAQTTEQKRQQYVRLSDSVAAFAGDCLAQSLEEYIPREELWNAYLAYCGKMNVQPLSTNNKFFVALKKLWAMDDNDMRPTINGKRVRVIRGVKYKPDFINELSAACPSKMETKNLLGQQDLTSVNDEDVQAVTPTAPYNTPLSFSYGIYNRKMVGLVGQAGIFTDVKTARPSKNSESTICSDSTLSGQPINTVPNGGVPL